MKKYIRSSKDRNSIRSDVYNALADVAFKISNNGEDISEEDFRDACDNFIRRFFDDDCSKG